MSYASDLHNISQHHQTSSDVTHNYDSGLTPNHGQTHGFWQNPAHPNEPHCVYHPNHDFPTHGPFVPGQPNSIPSVPDVVVRW